MCIDSLNSRTKNINYRSPAQCGKMNCMNRNTSKLLAALCRWTARVLGTLLLSVVVLIAIGEGMPNPCTQPGAVQVGFLALAVLLLGILAGWRWELAGGLISLAGWCAFMAAVVHSPRGLHPFVLALALPGVLYLASALSRRRSETQLPA